jgi:hypothetical protein
MTHSSDPDDTFDGSDSPDCTDKDAPDDATDASSLIDPNLSETREAFGSETDADASVGAAAAALQEDREKSAATESPRASAPAARRKNVDPVPGLEPEDGNLGIEPSVARSPEHSEDESPTQDETNEKVSELTMLGVEQMLRRSERGGDRRWRWGWIVTIVAALAVLGGLGFLLHRHAGSFSAMPQAAEELANEWIVYPADDAMAPEDRFSIRGLQLAVETGGWRPEGQESVIETTTDNKVMQTYARENIRIHAAFHDLGDRAEARKLVARTELPARPVRCDTKVVVLEPATASQADHVEGLALLLEKYRQAVIDASDEASR